MNRISQNIIPWAVSIGLALGLDMSAIAYPRYSYPQYNRSEVIIITPSRYGRRYYNRRHRGFRPYRTGRYNIYNHNPSNRRFGRRTRGYYSGPRIRAHPRVYRDFPSNGRGNRNYIRIIKY